jgi:hypothetical protein
MGISIHYTGRLKAKNSLPGLIEEVKDIAVTYKWHYYIFEEEFPAGSFGKSSFDHDLYGICFTPPGCEMVSLTFLSNGKLVSQWAWQYYFANEKDKTFFSGVSVKTHYAGAAAHKVLIHLLDHLSRKYFRYFKLSDEGQYWETRDEKLLDNNFRQLNAWMESFSTALDTQPMKEGETFEKYFERLLHQIHRSKAKKD